MRECGLTEGSIHRIILAFILIHKVGSPSNYDKIDEDVMVDSLYNIDIQGSKLSSYFAETINITGF